MASHSPADAKVYSIEPNELFIGVAKSIHKHAGMDNKIIIKTGIVEKLKDWIKETGPFDFIFIDHVKNLYLSDYELLKEYGAIVKGLYFVLFRNYYSW